MLGRFLARRLGLLPRRRASAPKAAVAVQIALTADLPEVELMIVEPAIARALGHPKVIARDF